MSFEKKLATPVAPLVLLLLMVLVLLGKGWEGLFWGGSNTCTLLS
jgi:hypothetical protein